MSELRAEWFRPEAISPETTAFNAKFEAQVATQPHATTVPVEQTRASRDELNASKRLDHAEERSFGPVASRILRPDRIDGVFLWIHGGGWRGGRPWYQEDYLWDLANFANVATVSVGYRLSPEHPYPAGPDDCEAAASWVIQHAASEFGTERIVIGGASAGGHLAAVTLQRMRDRHGYTGFLGADLLYGVYDLGGTPWMRTVGETVPAWDWRSMQQGVEWFAGNEDLRAPDVSPLYGELTSMPPALFSIGTRDSLLEDSLFMHARWLAAGNEAELAIYPGGIHGFDGQDLPIARESRARRRQFVRDRIASA
ncbi:MAG: alpha/beta hydrolase [Dehalococcoidia bacterium]